MKILEKLDEVADAMNADLAKRDDITEDVKAEIKIVFLLSISSFAKAFADSCIEDFESLEDARDFCEKFGHAGHRKIFVNAKGK